MKKNNANTAHDWNTYAVDGTPASGEGSNTYYEGPRFYSYSTCIARHFGTFALVSSITYSNTTSKHLGHVYGALSVPALCVPNPDVPTFEQAQKARRTKTDGPRFTRARYRKLYHGIEGNLDHFKSIYDEALLKSSRAKKYARFYFEQAQGMKKSFYTYCESFGIKPTKADRAHFEREIPQIVEKFNTENARALKAFKARKRAEKRAQLQKIADFYAGESNSAPTKPYDLIRLEIDSKGRFIVRTGRQVVLSASYVLKLWKGLKEGQITEGAKVDIYTLRSVKEDTIEIGCHTYHREYLEQFFTFVEGQICNVPEGITNFVYTDWKGGKK